MTTATPPPSNPADNIPTLIDASVQALLNNANRLGLTWNMAIATITMGTNPQSVRGLIDGDSAPILMKSMIGEIAANTRVYVIQVPPGNNYVAGLVVDPGPNLWLDYTPTTANITPGSGATTVAQYRLEDDTVDYTIQFTLGTGGSLGSDPRWGLPIQGDSSWTAITHTHVQFTDASTGSIYIALGRASASQLIMRSIASAIGLTALVTATVPFTWAVGDQVLAIGRYRAALPIVYLF